MKNRNSGSAVPSILVGVAILVVLVLAGLLLFKSPSAAKKSPLGGLDALVVIPNEDKDAHGSPVRKGTNTETGLPLEVREKVTGMHLVFIPAGTFQMGSKVGPEQERPIHTVKITRPFYAGKYEVTVGEFKRFISAAGYKSEAETRGHGFVYTGSKWEKKPDAHWQNPYFKQEENHPVVLMSWNDATKFSDWMNQGLGEHFRLPTEAQWEYLARAGAATEWFWGAEEAKAAEFANIADAKAKGLGVKNAAEFDDGYAATAPVGRFKPNAFGLYDVIGNVFEWCADPFEPDFYSRSPEQDPICTSQNPYRVMRGGGWFNSLSNARVASRLFYYPGYRYHNAGFRVVLSLPVDTSPKNK